MAQGPQRLNLKAWSTLGMDFFIGLGLACLDFYAETVYAAIALTVQ